ncbi:aminotransferase class III-fold pyridoxal phosphate-dependent enzyme [Frigidibacter sp. ROC022]|uniref:aminotransferase class III-fold pyridoxal phosphate-dependent enzyme n=1 Tax=Frigidibacter sp. ROC022 TaxID=2971796 RepID=UPI00215AF539|nr:aminotransferase class III-fold pyridoxal phosphate-dependent enzyme [Frigidibacter sp. ROC022]MCR8726346.1 aminotransferase class III-fold pyridoxal phosphate-dependent enzyme [Frigidibacter sp. ROC022]
MHTILNTTDELVGLDQAHVLHPFHHLGQDRQHPEPPLILIRGEGARVWDSRGRDYFDAVGGLWCTNIGLGRREMARVIAEQAEKLAFASTFGAMNNEPSIRLAARVAELAPGDLNQVHFTTGGSTATDTAFRMVAYAQSCMGFPEKRHVISRSHSYHGGTYAAMSLGRRRGDQPAEFAYESETIHHVSAPYQYRPPEGVAPEALTDHLVAEFEETIARIGPGKVGGFFAEPIQASGGILVPPPDYFPRMAEVCRRHGILFVADEVVTAWGRVGHWFASDGLYGVTPDIICTAKGLSSAYQPIGAVIFSDRIMAAMQSGERWFTSGFTYAGHPVACAAALKNIEILEDEGLLANAARVGAHLGRRLAELRQLPLVGDTRGEGLMWCLEAVADKASRRPLPDAAQVSIRISKATEARGLLVRPLGPLVILSPALILTLDEADFIVDTLAEVIPLVADTLVHDGYEVS